MTDAIHINKDTVFDKIEDFTGKLRESWPETMKKIIEKDPFPNHDEFFIFTFPKWNMKVLPPEVKIIHQPRLSMPDPFWNTTLRKINKKRETQELLWTLPHKEGQNLYRKNKMFESEEVQNFINKKINGDLQKLADDFNRLHNLER